jgi:hypothetical protein
MGDHESNAWELAENWSLKPLLSGHTHSSVSEPIRSPVQSDSRL